MERWREVAWRLVPAVSSRLGGLHNAIMTEKKFDDAII